MGGSCGRLKVFRRTNTDMKGNRAVFTAVVVVVVLAAGWWLFAARQRRPAVDLLAQFDQAQEAAEGATLSDRRRHAQRRDQEGHGCRADRRHADHLEGAGARRRLAAGVRGVEARGVDEEGDGVLFMVGVSDGRAFEQLFTQHVNPFDNSGDRRWIPVMVDLSAYAGEEVELIFNTRSGQPGERRRSAQRHGALGCAGDRRR